MNRKDIQKSVWDRAFDNLDEEGNPIEHPRKIKTDGYVNRNRANRLKANSPEYRANLSKGLKGVKKHSEFGAKVSASSKGKSKSEEAKANMKIAAKNKPPVKKETGLKISQANKGKPKFNEEQKQKMREAKLGKARSEETRIKIKESKKIQIKPLITPDGPMRSRRDAATFYNVDITTIGTWLHKKSDQFYYISQEEYIMLTGKEI
jgi:hypothetical protein